MITFRSAWEDGLLLGCGALKEPGPLHGEIESLRTPQARRGGGTGRAILAHIIATARGRGYRRPSLDTGTPAGFAAARALDERAAFTCCGPFGDYREDPQRAFMQLDLVAR